MFDCLLSPSILFLVRCSQLEVYNELLKILKIKLYYFSSFKKMIGIMNQRDTIFLTQNFIMN